MMRIRIVLLALASLLSITTIRAEAAFVQCPSHTTTDSLGTTWPSCAYLLTINPDLSVTVAADLALLARIAADPGAPGAIDLEDNYVGVQNDSGRTIASMSLVSDPTGWFDDPFGVRGPSPGDDEIFDFFFDVSDRDFGLTFRAGGMGYEGPQVFFTNITCLDLNGPGKNCNSGTVNFDGGLAADASTYFALEGAAQQLDGEPIPLSATAAAAVSAVPQPASWLLLGSALLSLGIWNRRRHAR